MSEVIVYGMPVSNYVRTVRMALVEKGVSYRLEPHTANSPEMLALTPFGKVPAFRHGDTLLFESQAICRYIDDAFGGPVLRPGTLAEKGQVDQWVSAACDYAGTAFVRGYVLAYAIPKWQGREPDPAHIAAMVPPMQKVLGLLEGHMQGRDWVVGDGLTLADLFLAPMVFLLTLYPEGKEAMAGAPNLTKWLSAITARDSFQSTKPTRA